MPQTRYGHCVRLLVWSPRIVGILVSLFIGMFALDAVGEGKPFLQSAASWIALTFTMLFTVGALRAVVTVERWWSAGLEMLSLGGAVAVVAYASGAAAARLISNRRGCC